VALIKFAIRLAYVARKPLLIAATSVISAMVTGHFAAIFTRCHDAVESRLFTIRHMITPDCVNFHLQDEL
jgi:hypothetical protein